MSVDGVAANGPRVLVVDDDRSLSKMLGRSLAHLGLRVTLADCGHSAMGHLRERSFDVMVLDLQMPDMNGIDMLREASIMPTFPATILHSAYVDVPTTVEAMRAGACGVLLKPTSAAELARRIYALVGDKAASHDGEPAARPETEGTEAKLLLGHSSTMKLVRSAVRRVSRFRNLAVLVEGPTGTGKELVARSIHALSAPDEPLVSVNCAAIPAELFESELFGHDAGAFTGAKTTRVGLLEEAGAGVLFLDEVGELPIALQTKLLRVLETREFRRVGSGRVRHFRARVVSATNRSLGQTDVTTFRSDLYFRIAGHTIRTPPLRDHSEDIPMLAQHFCRRFCQQHAMPSVRFTEYALLALCEYDWPGNVRQLRAVVHGAVIHAQGGVVRRAQLEGLLPGAPRTTRGQHIRQESGTISRSLPDIEREMILSAYHETGKNLTRAAEQLGIPRTTLRDRLKRYGLR